jgi:enoyl-CoA hydratase/carnithine racemase
MFEMSISDSVATIAIRRGGRANSVPLADWCKLERLVSAANISNASLIVFRSDDPDYFCAGSDLSELSALASDPSLRKRFRGAMVSVFKRIRSINKPTVAIIDGGCYGTGLSIATACDVRIAGPAAMFAITPARFGISYPKEEVERLASIVGHGSAARLLYSCEAIDAAEAARIGLVEFVDQAPQPGERFIRNVAENVPASLLSLKASLLGRAGVDKRFDDHFASPECNSRLEAYHNERGAQAQACS